MNGINYRIIVIYSNKKKKIARWVASCMFSAVIEPGFFIITPYLLFITYYLCKWLYLYKIYKNSIII
jgi:hypothetical protein